MISTWTELASSWHYLTIEMERKKEFWKILIAIFLQYF